MKSVFVKGSIFTGIVLVLLKVLDMYYTRYSFTHKNLCEKSDWILNHQGQSFDYAVIGNSRAINMADILTIDSVTGRQGINLGLIGSGYAENMLVLKEFLKSGNTIKNLVIQVDMHSLNSTKELTYPFHNYNYMHLLNDQELSSIFKDNNPLLKFLIWKYIPFTRYMEFSNKYVFYKILKGGYECKTSDDFDVSKGTKLLTGPYDPHKQPFRYSYWHTRALDHVYLQRLIDLARQHGMQVTLYSAPVYNPYKHFLLGYDRMLEDVRHESDSLHIPFIDFSQASNPLCADTLYFNDNIHLNALGTKRFSSQLADSIYRNLQ